MKKRKYINFLIFTVWIGMACFYTGCGSNEEVLYMEGTEYVTETSGTEELLSEEGVTEDAKGEQTGAPKLIMVHVCGAVKEAGVYELAENSRVIDAVMAAGGLTDEADAEYVNLAAGISDGDKVRVPTKEEIKNVANGTEGTESLSVIISSAGDEALSGAQSTTGKVNINTADVEELCTLPGIGQTRATDIVAYRQENGGFSSIEDIMLVSGIKENSFQKIKDLITVN